MHPLIEQNREKIATLCRQYGVKRLDVFGSAVRDDFDPACSDVDVVARFDYDQYPTDPLGQFFGFKESLESLFDRPVDIISSKVIRNPYIRAEVERTRVNIYAEKPERAAA